MKTSQFHAALTVHSTLGADVLIPDRVTGREAVSEPFGYEVELHSEDAAVDFSGIVGKSLSVALGRPGQDPRWIDGVVTRFGQGATSVRGTRYRAELRPWLWLLTLRATCRIFQNKSVPEILDTLFTGHPVRVALSGAYAKREFCVQYRESDFDFASRLMEEEGIWYFFEHKQGAHTLVLADDPGQSPDCAGLGAARVARSERDREMDDTVLTCTVEQGLATRRVILGDYNFETPAATLRADSGGQDGGFVVYDYPGGFAGKDAGDRNARLRAEAAESGAARLRGTSTCRAFCAGHRFSLSGHDRPGADGAYLLLAVESDATQDAASNRFEAVEATVPPRPARRTPQPVIPGTQTAVVVGKSGEEIWTDSYGRVKVRFHWDRDSAGDETSSCWVRVAQGWAGKGWGAFVLPRVGQEVVVTFLEGDPDRPLVTGCVYNAAQTVPYGLPDAQTRTTLRSSSSPGGDGFNEIRLEDEKDKEELYLHAQRDLMVEVVRNRTVTLAEGDDALTVTKGSRTVAVEKDETTTIKGKRAVTVTGDETHTNEAKFTHDSGGDYVLSVTGNLTIKASGSITLEAGTSLASSAGTSLSVKGGTSLSAEAGTTLTAKGSASAEVSSSGITSVKGSLVKLN
ncbi:MAG TPA: type VI secretion system tip protein TssI/VgrG [Longimicrobium sp.]|jgi:type VI secretion system secreted protein VgrG|uniref:type VI secretion system Vgr family protein n=1 Tax=Longimicrobium sp. TaxID=2029185 RepID=UPI002ED80A84